MYDLSTLTQDQIDNLDESSLDRVIAQLIGFTDIRFRYDLNHEWIGFVNNVGWTRIPCYSSDPGDFAKLQLWVFEQDWYRGSKVERIDDKIRFTISTGNNCWFYSHHQSETPMNQPMLAWARVVIKALLAMKVRNEREK